MKRLSQRYPFLKTIPKPYPCRRALVYCLGFTNLVLLALDRRQARLLTADSKELAVIYFTAPSIFKKDIPEKP